jgi:hypothetical protein
VLPVCIYICDCVVILAFPLPLHNVLRKTCFAYGYSSIPRQTELKFYRFLRNYLALYKSLRKLKNSEYNKSQVDGQ